MTVPTTPAESRTTKLGPVFLLISGYIILNISMGIFTGEKVTFLLKDELHLSASTVTSLNLLIFLPTYSQPFMGAGMELYPLFGSRRRGYFIVAALLTALAWLIMALQPVHRLTAVVCCLLLSATGLTLRSVLVHAIMVALGNRVGNYKAIQSVFQFLPLVLVAAFAGRFGGIVTEHWSYRAAFGTAACVALGYLLLLPLLKEPESPVRVPESDTKTEPSNPRAALRQALKDRRLWAVTAFVAYFGLVPSPDTARPYFFSDSLHFSKTFIGELTGWGAFGAALGILLMQLAPRGLRLRTLAWVAASTMLLAMVPQLLIHDPLSAKIGMLAFNAIASICNFTYAWMWARACPKGLETVVYGTLASTQALFYYLCDWIGTHMYDWFGPASGHSAAYGWHWTLITCMATGIPLFFILLLLPKADPAEDHIASESQPEIAFPEAAMH
ncbi:MAG: MFS transporter [Armatimonas sp.]